jgi:hypothetical protein
MYNHCSMKNKYGMKKGFILSDNIITANILELKKLKLCHCTP